ncbi:T9SS type A sorting domain-containing protein [Reichenbachiella sp. MSK19-1]|uniref:NHL domain-containing protein n=1 Tax=Reichenbachiella sp. MSK19-1 TaxID=1897631 RepID=UPI001314FDDC|nr:T9SS type A sorting domain-containing protein [Reichenbachiella sp. MSK19-1]
MYKHSTLCKIKFFDNLRRFLLMLAILSMVSVSYAQNQAPVFTSIPVIETNDNVAYSYTALTSDSDRDRVTVTATTKPSWLALTNIDAEVTTFTGSGSSGSEDGHGTSASFNNPSGMAIDASGNIYVTDANTIRKISPSGDVTTLAGSAVAGDTDGNGVNATFNLPKGLAIDAIGNVYVADTYNFKIRKISPSGDVTTLAGSGNVASIDGSGVSASFNYPAALAVDATGNVYVADDGGLKIRKITPGGEVTTFAGSGVNESVDGNGLNASFISPRGLTIDAAGNLYVTSIYGHAVRKITPDGDVTTLAGSGTAGNTDDNGTSASFNEPVGIAVDGSGNLYVADTKNHKIRKISTDGDVTTLAGSGNPGSTDENGVNASFNTPVTVAVGQNGHLYVSDLMNKKIRQISNKTVLAGDATDQIGDHNVTLTASDGKGGTATQSFVLKVAKGRTIGTGNILYVNKNASGGDERGSSWINAVPELADALVWAKDNYDDAWATTPLKIYVAKGTYKPLYSPEDGANFGTDQGRNNSFSMVKNIQLYGGFDPANGIEDLTDTRILPSSDETAGTILSGDIGTADDATDNTYNVLVSAGDVGTASLDGFSITDGYANDYSDIYVNGKQIFKCSGAGVYNSVSSPTYKHVTLHNNSCTESGGGMFSYMSSPALQLVILKNNQAKDGGGITNQESSSPTLLNVSIQSNNASENGSGMYNVDESEPTLTNVSIVGNEASVSSEEVPSCVSQNSSLTLNNCIIWDVVTGDYTAQNSLIKGTSDTSNGNLDATDLTDTDIFTDPANGDYSLKSTSIAVNSGSNTLYTDAGGDLANDVDIAGNARLYDGIPSTDIIDMGAYEYLDNIDPVFTSTTTASFIENETGTAYTVTATDANTITYSLGSGNDEALFDIVGSTGVVTFKAAPDFENPADADEDNAYLINVIASDGVNAANQNVTITVTDVDDTDPEFTSATAVNFAENETGTAYTVTATDANTLTYSLGSGNDEALFDIVGSTGVVTFKTAPDFENPADEDEDNAYVINVIASDGVNTVNQNVTITVTDVDDTDPVFTSVTAVNFAENETGTAYTVTATDANTVTYSLGSGNDESIFNIISTSGVVTFKTAPDFESPADTDEDNDYVINVIASDGVNTVNQNVTITVTDVDDTDPVFTSATTASFIENETGTAYTVTATDTNTITYSLGSGNDEALFDIVGSTGVVTFKTAPNFESPADTDEDNDYVINVIASDGVNTANQNVTITVTDVDDTDPVFTSATTASFIENETGTAYTVTATDANTLTYSLGSDNDEALFDIVGSTGVVTFKAAPDFESPADTDEDNDYVINVIASDGVNTANQNVTITVTDVDDTDPVFTSATTDSFIENETGTAYTVIATDANTITYSLGSGNDEALFDIVGSTGVVTFKTAPNFENPADEDEDNAYVINVIASDGVNTVNQNVTITVTDVDDTDPVFTSVTAVNFAENETGTAYTVTATDANTITYSLGSGNDESIFNIISTSGVVTFKTAPDFENPADADEDNAYVINVIASDGVNTINQNVTITVTDVDDTDPVFTSATTASFIENETGTAYTVTATDANTITYSLGSGNDEALFDIVGSTGVVTFKAAPDFESPADIDEDNAYLINVIASDGTNTANQNVTITVTDVDDTNPVFTSATTASFIENETGTAYTVTATDANTITYSLGSGNDESIFNIISTSGVVTFKTSPDFESPADTDEDNDYVINVIASDGLNTANQNVTITVTDVDEVDEVITSTPSNELQLTEIALYPNPTSHQLNIDLSNYSGSELSVRITNVSGAQYFLQENISAQGLVVNVEDYASGIYLVMLTTNNSIVTKRVIVNP